jgi:hypothetical protein
LIDFGVDPDVTLDGLSGLNELRELCQSASWHDDRVPVPSAVGAGDEDALPWIG